MSSKINYDLTQYIYRTSILGADLNRNWQKPSSLMQPELVAIKEALNRIKESFVSFIQNNKQVMGCVAFSVRSLL